MRIERTSTYRLDDEQSRQELMLDEAMLSCPLSPTGDSSERVYQISEFSHNGIYVSVAYFRYEVKIGLGLYSVIVYDCENMDDLDLTPYFRVKLTELSSATTTHMATHEGIILYSSSVGKTRNRKTDVGVISLNRRDASGYYRQLSFDNEGVFIKGAVVGAHPVGQTLVDSRKTSVTTGWIGLEGGRIHYHGYTVQHHTGNTHSPVYEWNGTLVGIQQNRHHDGVPSDALLIDGLADAPGDVIMLVLDIFGDPDMVNSPVSVEDTDVWEMAPEARIVDYTKALSKQQTNAQMLIVEGVVKDSTRSCILCCPELYDGMFPSTPWAIDDEILVQTRHIIATKDGFRYIYTSAV